MKALIIRFSALGDVVQTTSVVESLVQMGYGVHFLTDSAFAPLLEDDPRIERVVHFSRKTREGMDRVIRDLQKSGPYDLLLDLHGKILSRWMALWVPARRKTTLQKASLRRRWWLLCRHVPHREIPMTLRMHAALRRIRPDAPFSPPRLLASYPSPHDDPGVVIVPFGGRPLRNWPAVHAYRLAVDLTEQGVPATLAGQGPWMDWPDSSRNFLNQTDLRNFVGLLQRARLVVTVDTSAAHIAAALGVPVVELWGPTHPVLGMRPVGRGPVFSLGLPLACRPCSLHGEGVCRRGDHACLRDLEPERVGNLVRTVLTYLRGAPCA